MCYVYIGMYVYTVILVSNKKMFKLWLNIIKKNWIEFAHYK